MVVAVAQVPRLSCHSARGITSDVVRARNVSVYFYTFTIITATAADIYQAPVAMIVTKTMHFGVIY